MEPEETQGGTTPPAVPAAPLPPPPPGVGAPAAAAPTPSTPSAAPETPLSSPPAPGLSGGEVTKEEVEAAKPSWSPTSVDWDTWDGTQGEIPEDYYKGYKSLYDRLAKYSDYDDISAKYKSLQDEHSHLSDMYGALFVDTEDPRIGEQAAKLSEWEAKYAELERSYEESQTAWDKALEEEAERYANAIMATHDEYLSADDGAAMKRISEILSDASNPWQPHFLSDLGAAVTYDQLTKATQQEANKLLKSGAPPALAIQLAQERVDLANDGRYPVTSGSSGARRPPAAVSKPPRDTSLHGVIRDASEQAFRKYNSQP